MRFVLFLAELPADYYFFVRFNVIASGVVSISCVPNCDVFFVCILLSRARIQRKLSNQMTRMKRRNRTASC